MSNEHILIAEDDPGLSMSLAFVLKNKGYDITAVADGGEALEAALHCRDQGRKVDLLITDIQMPIMGGIELLESLNREKIELPTIVITGHGEKEVLIELLRQGCDDFLPKPFEPADILSKVDEVLERQRIKCMARERAQSDLKNANTELSHEVNAYRKNYQELRREVDSAIATYRDFVDVDKDAYPLRFDYRIKAFRDLGGDYFGICATERGVDILVADVAGHDLAASYQTILIKSYFDENCRSQRSGVEFFKRLNQNLLEHTSRDRMVTAQFLSLDLVNMTAELVSAGHPGPILVKSEIFRPIPVLTTGNILGMLPDVAFEPRTFPIARGDRLFLYTDGVSNVYNVDGPNGQRNLLGKEGLEDLVGLFSCHNLESQMDSIWKYIMNFCRYKPSDDMLLLGVEVPQSSSEERA